MHMYTMCYHILLNTKVFSSLLWLSSLVTTWDSEASVITQSASTHAVWQFIFFLVLLYFYLDVDDDDDDDDAKAI